LSVLQFCKKFAYLMLKIACDGGVFGTLGKVSEAIGLAEARNTLMEVEARVSLERL